MAVKKLWQTNGSSLHPLIEAYTVGDDYLYDQKLLQYDIQASLAHAKMLTVMGVLTGQELQLAMIALDDLSKKVADGEFCITPDQEDGHTAIEQFLTEKYGDIGKKIHTGRSRNDQSLVMLRLYMKDKISHIAQLIKRASSVFKDEATLSGEIPMPGYTHMQRAMPASVSMWLGSYASGFEDAQGFVDSINGIVDQNPLGSASGFGIENFSFQRDVVTKALGFSKTQENPMYCGMSRGYFESLVLSSLGSAMILASKFAHDMLLFTTQEFDFVALSVEFTTGSSIMPQKRNYDIFEIMRGNAKVFFSYQNQISGIVSSIGGGYQRDLQLTKKPFMDAVELVESTLGVLLEIIPNIELHVDKIQKAMGEELYVTNRVYDLVNDGMSFRDAYQVIKERWNNAK